MRTMPRDICSPICANIEDGDDCFLRLGTCTLPHMAKQSEFNAEVQKNGVFPPPHTPTPSEELMLIYRTEDPSGASQPDPEAFIGGRAR